MSNLSWSKLLFHNLQYCLNFYLNFKIKSWQTRMENFTKPSPNPNSEDPEELLAIERWKNAELAKRYQQVVDRLYYVEHGCERAENTSPRVQTSKSTKGSERARGSGTNWRQNRIHGDHCFHGHNASKLEFDTLVEAVKGLQSEVAFMRTQNPRRATWRIPNLPNVVQNFTKCSATQPFLASDQFSLSPLWSLKLKIWPGGGANACTGFSTVVLTHSAHVDFSCRLFVGTKYTDVLHVKLGDTMLRADFQNIWEELTTSHALVVPFSNMISLIWFLKFNDDNSLQKVIT